jgi:hypothetical protein
LIHAIPHFQKWASQLNGMIMPKGEKIVNKVVMGHVSKKLVY